MERWAVYQEASKVILFIFQAALNLVSTCALFPAKTILEGLARQLLAKNANVPLGCNSCGAPEQSAQHVTLCGDMQTGSV